MIKKINRHFIISSNFHKNSWETMFDLKNSISSLFLFALKTSVFLLFLLDLFPVLLGSGSQRYAKALSCQGAVSEIPTFCTQNEELIAADAETMALAQAIQSSNSGAGEQALFTQDAARGNKIAILNAKKACKQANDECQKICEQEKINKLTGCRYHTTPDCGNVETQYENLKKQCEKEFQTAEAKSNFNLGELGKLLAGIGALLAALGVNDPDTVPDLEPPDDDDDDDCKGPHADKLAKCGGRSGPLPTRPSGLSGPGGPRLAGGDNPFQLSAPGGEPGGESKDNGGRTAAAPGGGSGGLGSFGAMGDSGLAANGEQEEEGASDSDSGDGGYMGAGGAAGGGSGGGYGRGLASFGSFAPDKGAKAASASDLEKGLKKLSNANTRGPASVEA